MTPVDALPGVAAAWAPGRSSMKRSLPELASWLFRETSFPNGVFLMTGTGIVPPNEFTLAVGDEVCIRIEGIGELMNVVAMR